MNLVYFFYLKNIHSQPKSEKIFSFYWNFYFVTWFWIEMGAEYDVIVNFLAGIVFATFLAPRIGIKHWIWMIIREVYGDQNSMLRNLTKKYFFGGLRNIDRKTSPKVHKIWLWYMPLISARFPSNPGHFHRPNIEKFNFFKY